jgi:hypothetical protein
MTGQAALFDAPQHDGQAPLWGGTFEWAPDPAGPPVSCPRSEHIERELEDQADELAARLRHQADTFDARWDEAKAHQRGCDRCASRPRPCREGARLYKEAQIAGDVLRMIRTGEL